MLLIIICIVSDTCIFAWLRILLVLTNVITTKTHCIVFPSFYTFVSILFSLNFHLFPHRFFPRPSHLFSWCSDGAGDSLFTFALVVTALTLMGTATMFILISVFVLINNSCYSHERATVNGIGQTCAALGDHISSYN